MDANSGLSDVKMWRLFMEVYDMDDDYLMEEILHLDYNRHKQIEKIIGNYLKKGTLTPEERQSLLGYYLLYWHDDELED